MPVRSIKLKLQIPRDGSRREATRALWTTHAVINEAVFYYQSRLLLMRGRRYLRRGPEGESWVEVETTRQGLDALVAEARRRNTAAGDKAVEAHRRWAVDLAAARGFAGEVIDNAQAADMLRELYEAIVPSSVGGKGAARKANGFLGPLTDRTSKGHLEVFEKLDRVPNWVAVARVGDPAGLEAAQAWIESEEGRARANGIDGKAKWAKQAKAARQAGTLDPGLVDLFIADLDAKIKEADGIPTLVLRLKVAGILPLFPPFLAPRIVNVRGAVSRWDRLALRSAAGHLLSWESWCRRAEDEHGRRRRQLETFREERITPILAGAFEHLRTYEVQRKAELARVALPMGKDEPFRISLRMVRGWPDLREAWRKRSSRTPQELLVESAAHQTRRRGAFGDPHLAAWLARPENHTLWDGDGPDAVSLIARLNAMEGLVERSRDTAVMTPADAVAHPRWVAWEAEGGSNLEKYELSVDSAGVLKVTITVLEPEDGAGLARLRQVPLSLSLAASGQIREPTLENREKDCPWLSFVTGSGERLTGKLGGADLLFDRDHLTARPEAQLADGRIGTVFLKLAIDIQASPPPEWEEGKARAIRAHFSLSAGEKSQHANKVGPGARVLSVDLGLRTFASCSVFELKRERPERRVAFPLPELGLWAVHERSFRLELPDEQPGGRAGRRWRDAADEELRRLRRALGRYRHLRCLAGLGNPADRRTELKALTALASGDGWPFEDDVVAALVKAADHAAPLWANRVEAQATVWRKEFGTVIGAWRRATRARSADEGARRYSGKSLWSVDYLIRVRRLLNSWSLLGRREGDIRRLDRAAMGRFAARLLSHIDGLKEDRLKTGADLVVQAARGLLRDGDGAWARRFDPCHVILFEDLSRYRMRTDRPRRENSQLMKWAHRAVPQEVAMQGELYGLLKAETGAAFSSRYRASTATPGIRCHALTQADLDPANVATAWLREVLVQDGLDPATLKPNVLVPLAGGEMFACVKGEGLSVIHADINAAQNLQRRFWTRHAEPFRLPACRAVVDGQEVWVPVRPGKRLLGGLKGFGWLKPTGDESGSCRWELASGKVRHPRPVMGEDGPVVANEGDAAEARQAAVDAAELASIEEEFLELSGAVTVFFRDPSAEVLSKDLWFPSKEFWSRVRAKTRARLLAGARQG